MDAQDLTKQISGYIQTEEKPQIQICLMYAGHFIRILIIQICVSLLKQVKTDSIWSYIVQIGQDWSAYGKNGCAGPFWIKMDDFGLFWSILDVFG